MTQAMQYWTISSTELCSEAKKMWLHVDIVSKDKNLFYISSDTQKTLFKSTDFWWNSALWFKICADKGMTYSILEANNLPTAKSVYISKWDFSQSQELDIHSLSFPLIIKPLDEAHGNWVMMEIKDTSELKAKLITSFESYENMIVQEQVSWDEVRVLVVKWDVVLARNRIPARVIWDGKNTIEKLIENENASNPLRGDWYESPLANIIVDDEILSYISKQEKSLNYIPTDWEKVQLRWNSNIGTWWTMINVTDVLHPETKDFCIQTAHLLWLEICGVDVLAEDISKGLNEQWGIILEVNATPSLWWEKELTGVNTAQEILKRVFKG